MGRKKAEALGQLDLLSYTPDANEMLEPIKIQLSIESIPEIGAIRTVPIEIQALQTPCLHLNAFIGLDAHHCPDCDRWIAENTHPQEYREILKRCSK
jgi:hypothetical protein